MRRGYLVLGPLVAIVAATSVFTVQQVAAAGQPKTTTISIPTADQFTPFFASVKVGERVQWVNGDADDHTVVSDDDFNTAGNNQTDHLLAGTATPGGPGYFTLTFRHAGTFVYYCRFHAHLDANHQPVAPGPNGGIQDAKGNFGTPMMGVITVR
jgi:plastocyanin